MSRYVFDWGSDSVEVDLSTQVLELEVAEEESFFSLRGRKDLESRPVDPADPSLGSISVVPRQLAPHLYAKLSDISSFYAWAPAQAFAVKSKCFDDGLLATVELLVQKGTPRLPGKRGLVLDVWRALRPRWPEESSDELRGTLSFLQAALSLTGSPEESNKTLTLHAKRCRQAFEADTFKSKPLGFYTWNNALTALFKQGRLLQEELSPESAELLARMLTEDPSRLSTYQRHLGLMARLTNPLSKPAVHEAGLTHCFFPPSDSHEGRLVKQLFGEVSPPDGYSFVDDFIQRIRDGRIETTPGTHSGVYDYQIHALAPLLFPERTPESERLIVGPKYRAELEAQFRTLFALTRETQLKQLESLSAGGAPLVVAPRLSIEPLAEHYRRRAEAYRFLRHVLEESLGADVLAGARRTLPKGTQEESLWDELVWMEQLFRGAHVIVRQELGCGLIPEADLPAAMLTRRWLRDWRRDSDISADTRCVVPVYFDKERDLTKVVAVMGFLSITVEARFQQAPQVRVFGADGQERADAKPLLFPTRYNTLCPVAEEVYVRRVPDRKEFRELCDTHGSREAILSALRA
ncbi:hypothetical protein HUA76_23475 [Myxococcus sp. CA056]|uniref:hypothetical protein n=1 Tax=Myxococcus sp. CA056 TaxID=2741740 RepID=UPI00157B9E4B|nr:hypothetical protein [Myxococcus sp. CA056]NTX13771.1 hypothetical protein [Myxococcus sp. CA056]